MILFVDDEQRRMETYVEELELSGYQVRFISDIDDAIKTFQEEQEQIELLILDVMMPGGDILESADTEFGLRTGICFYEKIRKQNSSLPIIIFTNISDKDVAQKIEKDENSLFLQKEEVLAVQLVRKVKQSIGKKEL